MSVPFLLAGLAGGVGLFLLGMWLMSDGLKLAAGPALERILARSTGTRLQQSSSAVKVATLGQALWVLFGSNVGTTMTGWLVLLARLNFRIKALGATPNARRASAVATAGSGLAGCIAGAGAESRHHPSGIKPFRGPDRHPGRIPIPFRCLTRTDAA